eukprot:566055-Hanusia_phi.AAC.1
MGSSGGAYPGPVTRGGARRSLPACQVIRSVIWPGARGRPATPGPGSRVSRGQTFKFKPPGPGGSRSEAAFRQ